MIEGNHIVYKKSLVWELKLKPLTRFQMNKPLVKIHALPPPRPTDATKEYQDHECYKKSAKILTQDPKPKPPKPLVEF